jgi:pimeloyl-ACP methyl ester carboxylesterase
VVLVTGFGTDLLAWALQAPELSQHYTVYMVDNRGVGSTDKPEGPYTIKTMAADLAGFFDAVGIGKAHLVGHSMGGMIAQRFAIDYPDKLRSLTLASTSCSPPRGSEIMLMLWTDIIEKLGNEAYVNTIMPWVFTFDFIDAQYDTLMMMRDMMLAHLAEKPLLPGPFRSQAAAIVSFDVADEIKNITAPTMVLVGKDDILTPPKFSEEIARRIPGSILKTIAGGHAYNQESPSAFNRALLDFFAKHQCRISETP